MKRFISFIPYPLKNLIYDANCIRKLHQGNPIIIYQMGKVGSSSIKSSLESYGISPVFHTHFLNFNHTSRVVRRLYNAVFINSVPTKIISMTREPFSRNESSFFERFTRLKPGESIYNYTIDDLIGVFFEKFYYKEPLFWYDVELNRITGLDIYDCILVNNEYIQVEKDNFDILVFKSELPNERIENLICGFLNIDDFSISNVNVTSNKKYATLYREFSDSIVYPSSYVEKVVSSKYFQFFYKSDQERILSGLRLN